MPDIMSIEFTAQDKTKVVVDAVKSNISGVSNEVNSVMGKFAGFAAALGGIFAVKEIVEFASKVIENTAALQRMSEVSGMSVESLTEFKRVAKLSGTDMEAVTAASVKLSKSMVEALDPASKAGKAFESIGVEVLDASGKMKTADQVMKEAAIALDEYQDGAQKSALMTEIFGKAGAQLSPFLKDLAEQQRNLSKMTDEQREAYQANLEWMKRTAVQAEEYEQNLKKLNSQGDAWKSAIVLGMIPALNDFVKCLLDAKGGSGGLTDEIKKLAQDGTIEGWTRAAITGASYVIDVFQGVQRVFVTVGEVTGGLVALVMAAFDALNKAGALMRSGDFKGGFDTFREGQKATGDILDNLTGKLSQTWANPTYGQKFRDNYAAMADGAGAATKAKKELTRAVEEDDAAVEQSVNAWNAMVDGLQKSIAVDEAKIDALLGTENAVKGVKEAEILLKLAGGELGVVTEQERLNMIALAKEADRVADSLKVMEQAKKDLKKIDEETQAQADALIQKMELQMLAANNLVDASLKQIEAYKAETAMMGMSTEERAKANIVREYEVKINEALKLGNEGVADSLRAQRDELVALVGIRYESQERLDFWTNVAAKAGEFGRALLDGPGNALQKLKDWARDLLAQLVDMFARRFVLQIAASITGSTALGSAAEGIGGNSFAGSIINSIFGPGLTSMLSSIGGFMTSTGLPVFSSLGTMFGNMAVEGVAAGFMGSVEAGMIAAGAGNWAGAIASLAGPIGLVLAAVGIIATLFADAGENPTAQIGFGGNAQAYDWEGVFGREGFFQINMNDAFNTGLANALKQIGDAFDPAILRFLDPAKMDGVIATLNAHIGRQFAFPEGDPTAGEQLTLDYLQSKYGPILSAIDATFGASVANWKGTSEELVKAIGEQLAKWEQMAAAVDAVSAALGLVGPATFAAQKQLVEMAGGVQAFTSQADFFFKNFYTDAERSAMALANAQKAVTDGFAALGIEVPKNKEAFRLLVQSQDLNTEAGRKMYTALMALAPAFAAASSASDSAAAAMMGRWAQVQAATGNSAGPDANGLEMYQKINQFRSHNAWTSQFGGAIDLVRQLAMITQQDFGNYSLGDQELIAQILTMARAQGLIGGVGNSTTGGAGTPPANDSTYDNGNDAGTGTYVGTSYNIGISAAEFSETLKLAFKQALAETGITTDTGKNDARMESFKNWLEGMNLGIWKGANALVDEDQTGPRLVRETRRVADAAELLVANGDRR